MRKTTKRLVSLLLTAVLLCSMFTGASAAFEDFTDVEGHWARETLAAAYADGLVDGLTETELAPDATINISQMITIICRVLNASAKADISAWGIPEDAWYRPYAARAAALGLIDGSTGALEAPMSRAGACMMLNTAFQLTSAEPDLSPLDAFADTASLDYDTRCALAAMVSGGYIDGYEDSTFRPEKSISRAEFLTLLYKIAPLYRAAADVTSTQSGVVIAGSGLLASGSYGSIFSDCSAENITLRDLSAERVVLRGESLQSLAVLGACRIGRLVLAQGTKLSLAPFSPAQVDVVQVGDGAGEVELSGHLAGVEVTGSGRSVALLSQAESLVISGDNNTVSVRFGSLPSLRITGENNTVILAASAADAVITGGGGTLTVSAGGSVGSLAVKGGNTTVQVDGAVTAAEVTGRYTTFSGSGTIGTLVVSAMNCDYENVNCTTVDDRLDHGIENLVIALPAPDPLPAGETRSITPSLSGGVSGLVCRASWYLNGDLQGTVEDITLGGDIAPYTHDFTYKRNMDTTAEVKYIISYTTAEGVVQEAVGTVTVNLENYPDEYYRVSEEEALNTVKTGYIGNYTTQWAIDNDYTDEMKTTWINAKGYSSGSKYLLWVNIRYQRLNVFYGEAGSWELVRTCLVGTGAGGATPVGVTHLWYAQSDWASLGVWPVVRFYNYGGSGYAFHSRIKYSNGSIRDSSIGFPCSHGCIRMYDEDIQWLYDMNRSGQIPSADTGRSNGTTVVIF